MAAISLKRKKWKKKLEKKTNFTRLEIWRPYLQTRKIEKKNHFFSFSSYGRHKRKTEKVTFIGGFFHVVA
jgi:hypothetical protein